MKNNKNKLLQELFDSNRDLLQRSKSGKVAIDYVKEDDVVLITIGSTRNSVAIELDDYLYLYYDPDNLQITGFTVTSYKQFMESTNKLGTVLETSGFGRGIVDPIASASLARMSFA